MKQDEEPSTLWDAMAQFQALCPAIPFDSEGKITERQSFRYTSLAGIMKVIRPHLTTAGLVVYWTTGDAVVCHVRHVDTGEEITAALPRPESPDWKKVGAALTYARRYTISLALGIVTEEDTDAPLSDDKVAAVLAKCQDVDALSTAFKGLTKKEQDSRRIRQLFADRKAEIMST